MAVVDEHADVASESLWWLALPPAIWIAHLLASYLTAAIYCAKAGSEHASLSGVRWAIAAYTLVALCASGAAAWRGLRNHRWGGGGEAPHDFDSPGDRHRFLGFTSLLLSGLALLGIVFVALPIFFTETCR
jgi:hypothetical protein